jgi:hypothetical protein
LACGARTSLQNPKHSKEHAVAVPIPAATPRISDDVVHTTSFDVADPDRARDTLLRDGPAADLGTTRSACRLLWIPLLDIDLLS